MSRLDRALSRLAERGDPIGSDLLLERLERQLTSESAPKVVALETRREPMSATTEQPVEKSPKERTGRRNLALALGAAVIVAAVGVSAWLIGDEPSEVGTPLSVAEEFIEAGLTSGGSAGLHLLTPQFLEEQQDFQNALAVWNDRYERTGPCEETLTTRIRCTVLHHTDFHEAGGLSPFEQEMTFVVNDAGQISEIDFNVVAWATKINPFNLGFMAWLGVAHPEEAAKMSGGPMGGSFNSEDARIALQYVDEFVAQSDVSPINP